MMSLQQNTKKKFLVNKTYNVLIKANVLKKIWVNFFVEMPHFETLKIKKKLDVIITWVCVAKEIGLWTPKIQNDLK